MSSFLAAFVGVINCLCIPQPQEPGLYLTFYWPGLGGHNCDDDCGHTSMTHVDDDLSGWTAACPVERLGPVNGTTSTVTIWGEEFWCIDAFGKEKDQRLTWVNGKKVYRIDIALKPPDLYYHEWNNEYVAPGDWHFEWTTMEAFEAMRASKE